MQTGSIELKMSRKPPIIWVIIGVAILYYVLGHLSFFLVATHSIVTPVFFAPEGVALAAGILFGFRVWPGVFIGQLTLALSRDLALEPSIIISAVNSLEMVIGVMLVQRWGINPALEKVRDLGLLMLLIFVILQPFSATLGTVTLWSFGIITEFEELISAWTNWWIGNSIAQSHLVPLLLVTFLRTSSIKPSLSKAYIPLLLIVIVAYIAFSTAATGIALSLVLFMPILVWLAVRSTIAFVCMASAIVIMFSLYYSGLGLGPFISNDGLNVFELNLFILGMSLSAQLLSIEVYAHLQLEKKLNTVLSELESSNIKLQEMSVNDGLTGIANRRAFDRNINEQWKQCERDGKTLSLLLIDIDFFKDYNDTYGHQAGDHCLITIGEILREGGVARRPGDSVARYGGEEFAVILANSDLHYAKRIAERIGSAVKKTAIRHETTGVEGMSVITVSIGIASMIPKHSDSPAILIKLADDALYEAKKRGRNRIVFANNKTI